MRKPMITRTVLSTVATVFKLEGETVTRAEYRINGNVTDEKKALRMLQKSHPADGIVKVTSLATDKTLYGVELDEFMAIARPMEDYFTESETTHPAEATDVQ